MSRSRSAFPAADARAAERTRALWDSLAKPPGSLGRLEEVIVRLAGAQGKCPPTAVRPRIVVFAASHGVVVEGVTPYPASVTAAMVRTFARGKAAISVLAQAAGATLEVVDVGVADLGRAPRAGRGVRVVSRRVRPEGTANIARGSAMTREDLRRALDVGREAVSRAARARSDVFIPGDMGIGNTTAAAAVAAHLLGVSAAKVTGRGTGLDRPGLRRKIDVVGRALGRSRARSPLETLRDLGGLEIAAITGSILEAPRRRLPVLLDGFVVGVAALVAVRHEPRVRPWLVPASRSAEPGHGPVLDALEAGAPLLDLGLRLGEASAAALALPLLERGTQLLGGMARLADVVGEV